MGGLIFRNTLPLLEKYKHLMGSVVMMGSPNLGYLNGIKIWVSLGMWLMRKINKDVCLEELVFTDKKKKEDCLLYKMS